MFYSYSFSVINILMTLPRKKLGQKSEAASPSVTSVTRRDGQGNKPRECGSKTNCVRKLSHLSCVVLGSGLSGVVGTHSDCPGHSLGAGMGQGPLPMDGLNALLCFGG